MDYSAEVDLEKMERIYFNLLSNALKFTPERGTISVSLDKVKQNETDFAVIRVSNSGEGISAENIRHIFDRFYQVDSHFAGSGIGLALAKAMVELHQGHITVESEQGGKTTFTVMIPFIQNENLPESFTSENQKANDYDYVSSEVMLSSKNIFEDYCKQDKLSILVIDDNADIRSYIKTVLNNRYAIIEAEDGEEGLKKAIRYVPDAIICDVMMPKMDGVELCRALKTELSTSHIPVILLTACTLDEQRITGFKSGADDYISKPFNSDVLEVRVDNLIENRKLLKELFRTTFFTDSKEESKEKLSDVEKTFLEKLKKLIEKRLADPDLNVEDLGQQIGLSRIQLYRKVKSLTNYSPNELLRIIRLKKAYHLLSTTELTISEVTYRVGFTSPSYFTKCFKEYYNESPSDCLKRMR